MRKGTGTMIPICAAVRKSSSITFTRVTVISVDGFAADMQFTNAKMAPVSGKSIDTHVLGIQRRLRRS
jgi:hypothetical protein